MKSCAFWNLEKSGWAYRTMRWWQLENVWYSWYKNEVFNSDSKTFNRCWTISRDILWIPYFSHFSVSKVFRKQKSTTNILNICKRIIIISVFKSLNSCWGDHVNSSKTQCSLMESAIGLESGNLILLPITYMTLNKSFKLWTSVYVPEMCE